MNLLIYNTEKRDKHPIVEVSVSINDESFNRILAKNEINYFSYKLSLLPLEKV